MATAFQFSLNSLLVLVGIYSTYHAVRMLFESNTGRSQAKSEHAPSPDSARK